MNARNDSAMQENNPLDSFTFSDEESKANALEMLNAANTPDRERKLYVIVGAQGTGKSMLARVCATKYNQKPMTIQFTENKELRRTINAVLSTEECSTFIIVEGLPQDASGKLAKLELTACVLADGFEVRRNSDVVTIKNDKVWIATFTEMPILPMGMNLHVTKIHLV